MFPIFLLLISNVYSSPVIGVANEEPVNDGIVSSAEETILNANDPSIALSDPIDSATKLLIDLDAHVQQFIGLDSRLDSAVTEVISTTPEQYTSEPQIYSALDSDIGLIFSRQGESVSGLLEQLDSLQTRIQETITQLTNRRRYILSAMLRPMLNSVRRIRANIVRIQSQLTSIQSAATTGLNVRPGSGQTGQASPSPAEQGALDSIRKRVEDIQKRIGDIISRISSSLSLPAGASSTSSTPSG